MIDEPALSNYEFGPFRLSLKDRLLYAGEDLVPLTPKLVDTLIVLVENRGHVMTKTSLMESLWPDSFVEESSLTQNISLLRKALAERGRGEYIATVPKRGYRFVAEVREVSSTNGSLREGANDNGTAFHEMANTELAVAEQTIDKPTTLALPAAAQIHEQANAQRSRRKRVGIVLVCVLIASIALAYFLRRARSIPPASAPRSIAVLPFRSIGPQADGDVLGLGLANAIILDLSSFRRATVLPTSSVFRYTDRQDDVVAIARELGVDAVLDGTVQRVGDRVRVTAMLIRSSDGQSIWAGTFDASHADMFTLQESISKDLTAALVPNLADTDKRSQHRPNNIQAFDSYSFGLYFWNKRGKENISRAVAYLEQSIREDPNFAMSHALLADCYFQMGISDWGLVPRAQGLLQARTEARRALQLDGNLAEAHTIIGMLSLDSGDFVTGEAELRRAVELDPNSAIARLQYGTFLYTQARFAEADVELEQAQQLDPLSPSVHDSRSYTLFLNRDYDGVIRACRKALELQPDRDYVRASLARAYALKGMFTEAFKEIDAIQKTKPFLAERTRIYVDGLAGKTVEAARALREFERSEYASQLLPYQIAPLYGSAGEKEKAFAAMRKAVDNVGKTESKKFLAGLFKLDPQYDSLRDDARLNEYVARLER